MNNACACAILYQSVNARHGALPYDMTHVWFWANIHVSLSAFNSFYDLVYIVSPYLILDLHSNYYYSYVLRIPMEYHVYRFL